MCVKAGLLGMTGLRFVYKMGFMDKKNNFMEVQQVDNAANLAISAIQVVLKNPELLEYIMQSGTPEMERTRKKLLLLKNLLKDKALKSALHHPGGFGGSRRPLPCFYDRTRSDDGLEVLIGGDPDPYGTFVLESGRGDVMSLDELRELRVESTIPGGRTSKRTQKARLLQILWWLYGQVLDPDDLNAREKEIYENMFDWMKNGLSLGYNERNNFYKKEWEPMYRELLKLQKAIDNGEKRGIVADPQVGEMLQRVNKTFYKLYWDVVNRTQREIAAKERLGKKREIGEPDRSRLKDGQAAGILANALRRKTELADSRQELRQSGNGAAGS